MLFIQESKLNTFDSRTIASLGGPVLTKGVGVEVEWSAGGLISLWDENLFTVVSCVTNNRSIILVGELLSVKKYVAFCNVYTPNLEYERKALWNDLLVTQGSLQEKELEEEFTHEEVWEAICSCDGNKAPGLDGPNLNFIKSNWDIKRDDFFGFLTEFYKNGEVVRHLNKTFIALIPKVGTLERISDFRPINLVGSMYKVLSKIGRRFANPNSPEVLVLVTWNKNNGLLAKWVWRFGYEGSSLWKKVICASYGLEANCIRWKWQGVDKNGKVQDFGQWQEDRWIWKVNLRRQVFDWEVVQWIRFLSFLDYLVIQRNSNDSLAWAFNANGIYSVKSFCRSLESMEENFDSSNLLWKSLCPLKIETFAWQLRRGRITVRDVLFQWVSDSTVAVSWANNLDDYGNFPHLHTILDIRGHLQSRRGLSVVYNPRSTNEVTDSLAKRSSNGGEDMLEFRE
ncbi:hypothetical protein Ddye_028166 [Dipteronia dyeriana]|uniref:Reverse transcriptase zinc-binding domain-containing protein n=1 Tax=Dipteronia dyeriana TaxID=168575 RepID=A0AAD9TR56_9ROSI|nr:hypothetical protein Ddye_028166 [Dipteronia dyeriana]